MKEVKRENTFGNACEQEKTGKTVFSYTALSARTDK